MCSHFYKNNAHSKCADTKNKSTAAIKIKKNVKANSFGAALSLLDTGTSNYAAAKDIKATSFCESKEDLTQNSESNSRVLSEETSILVSHLYKNDALTKCADTKSKSTAAIKIKKNVKANSFDAALSLLVAGTSNSNYAADDDIKATSFFNTKENRVQISESNSSATSEEASILVSHLYKNDAHSIDTKNKTTAAIKIKKNVKANSFDAALSLLDAGTSNSNYAADDDIKATNFSNSTENPAQISESNSSATSEETSTLVSMIEDIVTKPSSSTNILSRNQPIVRRFNKRSSSSNQQTPFGDELTAKKAKVKHGLALNRGSTTFVFPKRNSNLCGNFRSPRLCAPAIPVIARLSPAAASSLSSKRTSSSSINNTNSIHGRKTISIRELAESQIGRTQEVIKRLKAEQRNKALSSNLQQRPRPSTVKNRSTAPEPVATAPDLNMNENQTFQV